MEQLERSNAEKDETISELQNDVEQLKHDSGKSAKKSKNYCMCSRRTIY